MIFSTNSFSLRSRDNSIISMTFESYDMSLDISSFAKMTVFNMHFLIRLIKGLCAVVVYCSLEFDLKCGVPLDFTL